MFCIMLFILVWKPRHFVCWCKSIKEMVECLLHTVHRAADSLANKQMWVGRVILRSCKLQKKFIWRVLLIAGSSWPLTSSGNNMGTFEYESGKALQWAKILHAGRKNRFGAPDMFHPAENKLGGGWNWAIFQSARIRSIRSEASKPVSYMNHPLAIAQHNTTKQPWHHYPPPRASDSSWKPLAVELEANQRAAIPVTPHLVNTVWLTHRRGNFICITQTNGIQMKN